MISMVRRCAWAEAPHPYGSRDDTETAIIIAFDKIEQNLVLSSWKDALGGAYSRQMVRRQLKVPQFGVFTYKKQRAAADPEKAPERIFAIGGRSGWYYANWLWSLGASWISSLVV